MQLVHMVTRFNFAVDLARENNTHTRYEGKDIHKHE